MVSEIEFRTGMGMVKYRGITAGKTTGKVIRIKPITAVTVGTVHVVILWQWESKISFTK